MVSNQRTGSAIALGVCARASARKQSNLIKLQEHTWEQARVEQQSRVASLSGSAPSIQGASSSVRTRCSRKGNPLVARQIAAIATIAITVVGGQSQIGDATIEVHSQICSTTMPTRNMLKPLCLPLCFLRYSCPALGQPATADLNAPNILACSSRKCLLENGCCINHLPAWSIAQHRKPNLNQGHQSKALLALG